MRCGGSRVKHSTVGALNLEDVKRRRRRLGTDIVGIPVDKDRREEENEKGALSRVWG